MDRELFRNGSGYADPTAYKALKNYEKGENDMEYKRGEIFEFTLANSMETKKALIVSADYRAGNRYLSIIVLQDEPKGDDSVPVVTSSGVMYADCGMVSFAQNDRFGRFLKTAKDAEMEQISEGIARCLGIRQKVVEKAVEKPAPAAPAPQPNNIDVRARMEAAIYKDLYEQLLAKMIG